MVGEMMCTYKYKYIPIFRLLGACVTIHEKLRGDKKKSGHESVCRMCNACFTDTHTHFYDNVSG